MELLIKRCLPCQAVTAHNGREPLEMSPLPDYPWQKVAVDHAGPFPDGYYGLLVIDEYSRYPEIEAVTSTSMAANAPKFRKIFAAHGIPEVVKSDNGPPFHLRNLRFLQWNLVSNINLSHLNILKQTVASKILYEI